MASDKQLLQLYVSSRIHKSMKALSVDREETMQFTTALVVLAGMEELRKASKKTKPAKQ